MAYNDFTLSSIKKQFKINLIEEVGLFASIPPRQPSTLLKEILAENIPLALGSNTEKSRSEMIIAPILIELRKQFKQKISIFSGVKFNVDPEQGLNGNCDFIINQSSELLMITAPIITIVEAKKEDLNLGLGQCIAEMIAAQIFNERENCQINKILGVVTSGTNWKFLKLEQQTIYIDLQEYYLDNIGQLLGILASSILIVE
ncbi:MAG TPA: hypothetical protein DCF68_01630 [Cyanothece sp. UBA12306]|nr:hypothetical protein [Cyanothece sp. UBA12306]